MTNLSVRRAEEQDIPTLARLRSRGWGTVSYWQDRMTAYLNGSGGPTSALPQRMVLVALDDSIIAGVIAGHFSHRFNRDAEVQWLDVHPDFSRQGIATTLWACLAHWLVDHGARNVLVNVEPGNEPARAFYAHQGAQEMNDHWMEWARLDRQLPAWPEGAPAIW